MSDRPPTNQPVQSERVLTLWLCETKHLLLKPDVLYVFRVDPNCSSCSKLKSDGEDDSLTLERKT